MAGCRRWLHRIDEHLEIAGSGVPGAHDVGYGVLPRNCWISTECEDPFVADVIRWLGDDHIVYETDFPHPDAKFPHATEEFLWLEPELISIDSKRKILWDDAIDLYRFPESMMPTTFAKGSVPALERSSPGVGFASMN